MKIPIYQIDAFTSRVFGGNPAAVCPLEQTAREEAALEVPHRHIRAVGDENDVERKTACPTMALAPEMSLPEEVARVQAQTSDGCLEGFVVRSRWMES